MAYRYDEDLEFLRDVKSSDFKRSSRCFDKG